MVVVPGLGHLSSLCMLTATICAPGISAVSDISLRKHFLKASSFLQEI